jgi:hypothetical protein
MTLITKDITTVTEISTLVGQGHKAMVMWDTSTGEASGLDVDVLINIDASLAAMDDVISSGGIISNNNSVTNLIVLTSAEFDSITTKDPKTLYFVKD